MDMLMNSFLRLPRLEVEFDFGNRDERHDPVLACGREAEQGLILALPPS